MNGQILRQVRTKLAAGFNIDEAINAVLTSEDRCECIGPQHGPAFPCFRPAIYRLKDGSMLCGRCFCAAHMPQIGDGDRP